MKPRRRNAPATVQPWMVAVPVVVGVAGLTYALVRWIASDDIRPGDRCSIDTYRAVLRPNTSESRIQGAWTYMPYVRAYSHEFGVDPTLLAALIQTESGWEPEAGSSAGAVGLTQFIDSTARSIQRILAEQGRWPFGRLDRTDPQQSIWLGAAFLRRLLDKYDTETALAVYNAGPKVAGRPSSQWPSETQAYVPGVLRRQAWFRALEAAC